MQPSGLDSPLNRSLIVAGKNCGWSLFTCPRAGKAPDWETKSSGAVVLRKMPLDVAAVVKNAGHLDHAIVAAAIQEKMARLLHPYAAHFLPAEFQVIRARALDHHLGPFFRARPLGFRF